MARVGSNMALATLFIVTMFLTQSLAQSGCSPASMSLSSCLGFFTGTSTAPTTSCCTDLTSMVQSQAQCLCSLISGSTNVLGLVINQAQAVSVFAPCNILLPPVSQCSAAGVPSTAGSAGTLPNAAPAPTAPVDPSTALAPASMPSIPGTTPSAGTGSKAVPTTKVSSSAMSSSKLNHSLLFFVLFVGYASALFRF